VYEYAYALVRGVDNIVYLIFFCFLCKEGIEESYKALELGAEEMSSLVLPSEMDELQSDMTKIASHMAYCLDVLDEVEGRLTHLNVYFN